MNGMGGHVFYEFYEKACRIESNTSKCNILILHIILFMTEKTPLEKLTHCITRICYH